MLEIEGVCKKYKSITAVDDVNLSLTAGIYALLGPNSAGKSTLLRILTLGTLPDKGSVKWMKEDIRTCKTYSQLVGYMPQQQALYKEFSGYRFLNYMCVLKGVPKNKINSEIERAARAVNLEARLGSRLSHYSGGMKQRILLASALIGDPKLLILDEPTAGLDPKERVRTRKLIEDAAGDRIIIIATHIVSDIESIADKVLLMKKGKIIECDSPEKLCGKYTHNGGLEDVYMHFFSDDEEAL